MPTLLEALRSRTKHDISTVSTVSSYKKNKKWLFNDDTDIYIQIWNGELRHYNALPLFFEQNEWGLSCKTASNCIYKQISSNLNKKQLCIT